MSSTGDGDRQPSEGRIVGAITYPGPGSNAAAVPVPVQPRQPHNLQGLLRFAMEATQAEDAPGNSNFAPLDEERRRFLEEALRSLTVDVAQVLRDSIRVLTDAERVRGLGADDVPPEVAAAFTNLSEFIEDIDIANDFYKLGGLAVFPVCLGSQSDAVRARACGLLAEVCQNNPYTQARTLETGLLNVLISMAENEHDPHVLAMTTFALSCCTREFEPSCKEFISQNGCDVLIRLLSIQNVQVRTKAAFLTRYFCSNWPEAKAQLLEKGLVQRLAALLAGSRDSSSEHVLSSLAALAEDQDSAVLDQLRDPDVGLRAVLESYLQRPELQGDTDFLEERDYCKELLKFIGDTAKSCDEAGVER